MTESKFGESWIDHNQVTKRIETKYGALRAVWTDRSHVSVSTDSGSYTKVGDDALIYRGQAWHAHVHLYRNHADQWSYTPPSGHIGTTNSDFSRVEWKGAHNMYAPPTFAAAMRAAICEAINEAAPTLSAAFETAEYIDANNNAFSLRKQLSEAIQQVTHLQSELAKAERRATLAAKELRDLQTGIPQ